MQQLIDEIDAKYKKAKVTDVRSGDTVRVHQKIKEGKKERVQVFEGLVIKTRRKNSLTNSVTVRRIASGVGVEKTFLLNSPLITKVEVVKRSKVRRNYLSYMRNLSGKSARLDNVDFDDESVNVGEQSKEEAGLAEAAEKPVNEKREETPKEEEVAKKPEAETKLEEKEVKKEEAPTEKEKNDV